MKKIGITGQKGFIGQHLIRVIKLYPQKYQLVEFANDYFQDQERMDHFVSSCDTIIHLAAVNRHENPKIIYNTNIGLVRKLIDSCKNTKSKPHILISSSTQEELGNLYGRSKMECRMALGAWAKNEKALFTGLIIPNVYGPFGKPYYNSVVATFCHQLTHRENPIIHNDNQINLIYVGNLVTKIIECIELEIDDREYVISADISLKVSEILAQLNEFKVKYFDKFEIPDLDNNFSLNLFNTFRSFIDLDNYFPVNYKRHSDDRGVFVEIARLGTGGQVSFSTTASGVTRGNHYHTRKIERFAVISGKAKIELRLVGTDKIYSFEIDGKKPAYVDMPIWYTHNITNTGDEELLTVFWINEPYDLSDSDTYFEEV